MILDRELHNIVRFRKAKDIAIRGYLSISPYMGRDEP